METGVFLRGGISLLLDSLRVASSPYKTLAGERVGIDIYKIKRGGDRIIK